MALTKPKRQKMEKLIQDTFSALDPTLANSKKYKEKFSKMTDAEFDKYFKQLFASEQEVLVLDMVDYERDLKIEHIEDAAKVLNIPLFEHVAMPFANNNKENPVLTKYPVPVGYIHIKAMQQMLKKKNTTSTNIGIRSALTGQVSAADKNSRSSDMENFTLVTLGANETLREYLGPRADDLVAKNEMYSSISQKGFVSLNSLTDNVKNKTTLNTIDVFMIGMGLKTDLVTKGLETNKTLDSK